MKPRVIIVGGGLAGLAAAIRLVEYDYQPVLLETRRKLGGRATSFVDPRNGSILDNCQHVLLGCCTNLIDLYNRLGVLDRIEWHRKLYWTAGAGEVYEVEPWLLPAPFHYARSFTRLKLLSSGDRAAVRRMMWRMIRMGASGRQQWAGRSFLECLNFYDQTAGSIDRFWEPIIVSACNTPCARVDSRYALQVFLEGFLANRWASSMGISSVPLAQLYDPAVTYIEERGGEVHLGCSVRSICYDGRRVTGVVSNVGIVKGSAIVAAVPPDRLDRLISAPLRAADDRLQSLAQFEFNPILGVHLWFQNTVMHGPHLTVVGHGVQWLFNKGQDNTGHQHLHAVISAAGDWMELSEHEIVERVMKDIHDVLPASRGLSPVQARSVKEKHATFAATPHMSRLRPSATAGYVGLQGGGVENLYLAGDWCDTGWPATMEGAVRSGYSAASAILQQDLLEQDAPPARIASLLGLR